MRGFRRAVLAGTVALAALSAPAAEAEAEVTSVFDGEVPCQAQSDGVRFCGGSQTTVATFDGVPIDVNVALPAPPESGPDGNYPMVMMFHGWGGSKLSLSAMRRFADHGYAVFTMSDRGWGDSCGGMSPTRLTPECADGHNRLMDTRYEVRDAQEFAGRLVDEGLVDPQRIGSTGGSYGGGLSMALGALRDRKMLPDGSLVPWTSPEGTPMEIAATAPEIPWTDLAYALTPNGRTLDYVADAPYTAGPIGVLKQSFVAGLFATGLVSSNYAAPGADPDADLIPWYALLNAGEPYDTPLAEDIVDEVTTHHSSYYIDPSVAPAPMLISNGWTDDLFPADEAIRFYNRTNSLHPGTNISLMFLDYGHQRGESKAADTALLRAKEDAWFDHYLKGEGAEPGQGVTTLTQTCPSTAASGGPYEATSWADIAPGEVRLSEAAQQIIAPAAGNPAVNRAFDPIAGGGDACATAPADDQLGVATYRLDPAPAGGYTLMGSPTVIADVAAPSPTSQVAARLLDVDPQAGTETLVGRALYRPDTGSEATRQVFQLHPNGWHFAEGHIAKLELLPNDAPYGRASNGQGPVTVSNLELRLPVLEQPGGVVSEPAPKFVPEGYELAPGYVDADSDGDGVSDDDDDCPAAPGPASNNGCPLPDADGDGVPDADDECDDEPGPASNQGCPETQDDDADGDGVLDSQDACPDDPGPASNAGCPEPPDDDADDDGVPDADDDCPAEPGPIDNGGCPAEPATCTTSMTGTDGDDRLKGTGGSELMRGRAGDDVIHGRRGDDCLRGQSGADRLDGGRGDDDLRGGAGADHIDCGRGRDVARVSPEDETKNCEKVVRR